MLALRFKNIITRARRTLPFATQKVKLTGLLIVTLLSLYSTPYLISPVHAADATPSADIKAKLEELKKEIASKAAQLKKTVDRKLKDKAYVGTVKTSSETSLTLAANSGPKMVSINQDTVFENKLKAKQKLSQKTITEGDYIAALGDIDETGVLIAKKIIVLPAPDNENPKKIFWGQIIAISDKLATLKDRSLKSIAISLPTSSEAKLNDFVILTGNVEKNDIVDSGFVYVIPQGTILKPKKIATPSAQTVTTLSDPAKPENRSATKSANPAQSSRTTPIKPASR